ncbi:MerR family transcriptional regulator [Listeria weihenstephanensis]|uniref:MerR family transcriptional regulator n=1 Tax=Listeria weihenstephanensis TaxID=1006155 RepID=A0A841Z876_9LIST|nr:MerR family transcriptional regulator [Listeria weihenstephanensis]MBC1500842.1 MerR family transcriptional regulator [Listeria weihenstephanensis]
MRGHELGELLHIPTSTLHYYEKKGLIQPEREGNHYRNYSARDVQMLKYILILKEAGLTLAEIKQVFHRYFHQSHDEACQREGQHFFNQKIKIMEEKIARYNTIMEIMKGLPVMLGDQSLTAIQEKNEQLVDDFFEKERGGR